MKNGLSRSEQKTVSTTQNNRLTGKAPYKFESIFLQRRVRLYPASGTRIDLPMFREESGVWRRPITLPDEPCGPIGRAVLDELVERGLAVRGPDLAVPLRLV